jgi:two-component system phosphate regulon sensor histidine kinase PhoR
MKPKNYKYILLFITLTVLATIGLQVFWNIKSYKETKTQLIKEVQTAFDNSIEYYYVEDSKDDFLAFIAEGKEVSNSEFMENLKLDTVFEKTKKKYLKTTKPKKKINTSTDTVPHQSVEISSTYIEEVKSIETNTPKPKLLNLKKDSFKNPDLISSIKVLKGKKATDSISKIKNLANKIIISMIRDSVEFKKITKALDTELLRKNIDITYTIKHFKADTLFAQFPKNDSQVLPLSTISGTTFLPQNQKLQISFSDPTILLLKRSFTEIFLSLLLSLSTIFCLLYLLRTINKQKKIDLIKNDLISNITHEFKTPITTISTAIEGIKNFNHLDDKEKTNRYLDISGQQLKKLEIMVEKLLETASLDSNKLALKKETINIIPLLKSNVEKHQMASEKTLAFTCNQEEINWNVDVFHFENAVSNLIDNAIKYGGENITIEINQVKNLLTIAVKDNGNTIDKSQREKIFDQFYRIPKGNIHDVKGFGIGLFYAKKITEKHNGSLELIPSETQTIFQITLHDVR